MWKRKIYRKRKYRNIFLQKYREQQAFPVSPMKKILEIIEQKWVTRSCVYGTFQ